MGTQDDELLNFKAYCQNYGIQHQTSLPDTPQQNGRAERWQQTIMNKARSILLSSPLPNTFWWHAVKYAIHTYNRTPASRLKWKTPIELWDGKPPDVSGFHIFGCKAYVHVHKHKQHKLQPRAEPVTFIGYPEDTKGYLLWTGAKIIDSYDVTFDESAYLQTVEPPPRQRRPNHQNNQDTSSSNPTSEDLDIVNPEFPFPFTPSRSNDGSTSGNEDQVDPPPPESDSDSDDSDHPPERYIPPIPPVDDRSDQENQDNKQNKQENSSVNPLQGSHDIPRYQQHTPTRSAIPSVPFPRRVGDPTPGPSFILGRPHIAGEFVRSSSGRSTSRAHQLGLESRLLSRWATHTIRLGRRHNSHLGHSHRHSCGTDCSHRQPGVLSLMLSQWPTHCFRDSLRALDSFRNHSLSSLRLRRQSKTFHRHTIRVRRAEPRATLGRRLHRDGRGRF